MIEGGEITLEDKNVRNNKSAYSVSYLLLEFHQSAHSKQLTPERTRHCRLHQWLNT